MERCTIVFPVRERTIYLAKKQDKLGKGYYNGWGGKEKPEDRGKICITAAREFTEETGGAVPCRLEPVAIIDFYRAGTHLLECHMYLCSHWHGNIMPSRETGPPEPFSFSRLPLGRMMRGDRLWLPRILAGQKVEGKIYYDKHLQVVLMYELEEVPEIRPRE